MALIKCPECGKDVSDKAKACPKCGYPIAEYVNGDIPSEESEGVPVQPPKNNKGNINKSKIFTVDGKKYEITEEEALLLHCAADFRCSLYSATSQLTSFVTRPGSDMDVSEILPIRFREQAELIVTNIMKFFTLKFLHFFSDIGEEVDPAFAWGYLNDMLILRN